jgi:hypothetical protein
MANAYRVGQRTAVRERSSGVIAELNVILDRRLRPMRGADSIGGG